MDRFQILLNKNPEECKEKDRENLIHSFSFDDSINVVKKPNRLGFKDNESVSLGLVYADIKDVFIGSYTHYDTEHKFYFLCKNGLCCRNKRWPYRKYRVCCLVARYFFNSPTIILPWVFSATVFGNLKHVHKTNSLFYNDFSVTKNQYNYDFQWIGEARWLKEKNKLMPEIQALLNTRKSFLGQDLTIEEICLL